MYLLINLITYSRILLAVVIFVLIVQLDNYFISFILFFLASIADYYDGMLARKYNLESVLGEILDPVADKILVTFVLLAIAINISSAYVAFCAAIIISRDTYTMALRDVNSRSGSQTKTKVTFIAKFKTAIQMFTISFYILSLYFNNGLMILVSDIFLLLVTILTIYTGYLYSISTFKK